MRKFLSKRRTLAALAAVAVLAMAGAAYAYFTSVGSGSGSATVGSTSSVNLSSTVVGDLFPGAAATPVTVKVHNPGGGTQHVATISGTVADNGTCLGSWFTVASVTYNHDVAGGADGPDGASSVKLNETGSNQDACQGKTVVINWSSN
jgi:hypothetical protein